MTAGPPAKASDHPLLQPVTSTPAPPPLVWAKALQLVTCDYGHPIARFKSEIAESRLWRSDHFYWIIEPAVILTRCQCGRHWSRFHDSKMQMFIAGEWR
jgi:hypothetical protein